MIKRLLINYINFAEKTGWKTFFKVIFVALLYTLILCLFHSDVYGLCLFFFPLNVFSLFVSPLATVVNVLGLDIKTDEYTVIAIYLLIFSAILINVYRLVKPESAFCRFAKKISLITKMILISYLIIIVILYAYYWISGEPCSPEVCGFLKGYY